MSQPSPATLTAALLDAAKKAGADGADAIAVAGTSISIDVRQGRLEQAERAEGTDIGLRVLIGRRQAVVSASDMREGTLAAMAERAVAMAREAPEDPHAGLADPSQIARDTGHCRARPARSRRRASPRRAGRRRARGGGRGPGGAGCRAGAIRLCRLWRAGRAPRRHQRLFRRLPPDLAQHLLRRHRGRGHEMERDYDGDSRTFQADLRTPEEIGRSAGERTVARPNPRRPKTGAYPVLFDERISSSLIGHLLAAINGSAIARGASWLRDAMGEQVLPGRRR